MCIPKYLCSLAAILAVLTASQTSATELNRLLLDQPEPQMSKDHSFDPNPASLLGTVGYYSNPGCYLGNCDPCSLTPSLPCSGECKAECARGYNDCTASGKSANVCKSLMETCIQLCS